MFQTTTQQQEQGWKKNLKKNSDGVLGVKSFTDSLCNNEYVGISSTIHKSSRYCGNEFAPGDENVESGVVFCKYLNNIDQWALELGLN